MSQTIAVVGIGTDVGKTVVSAILAEAFYDAYWKPIQAGDLHNSDSLKVKNLCSENLNVLPEKYTFKTAASPHLAAKIEGIEITHFDIPTIQTSLLIEAAGGLMVPLNDNGLLFVDLLKSWQIPVILVSKHYLGSINHTLLSLEILKSFQIETKALIFVGDENIPTETIIQQRFPIQKVHRIPLTKTLNREFISEQAEIIRNRFEI